MSVTPERAHHEIRIRRVGNDAVPQLMPRMHVGDTVQYSSDDGAVSIEFPTGSPFRETRIGAGQIVTVQNTGTFRCRCFIDLKDQAGRIGWKSDPSPSGADHDVPK
jgi:hypothetical protein